MAQDLLSNNTFTPSHKEIAFSELTFTLYVTLKSRVF